MSEDIRVKFIPIYHDDFMEDRRVMQLNPSDRPKWLFLIVRMSRLQARLPDNTAMIAQLLYIKRNDALRLKNRLVELRLLIPDGNDLISPRLMVEYKKAVDKIRVKRVSASKGGKAAHAQND
jgi:hypothetical protein